MVLLEAKVTGRGRPWQLKGGKKKCNRENIPTKGPTKTVGMANVSFQGHLGTQGHRQRRPRITELPTDPTAKAQRKGRAAGTAKYTGKLGKSDSFSYSHQQTKQPKNGLGCLVWPCGCAPPRQQGCHSPDYVWMSLSRVEQYTVCMWQLQSSIIPASLRPQRI